MITVIVFAVCSTGLVWFSRPWLRNRRAHGFYRFFGLETILVLLLFNVPRWFEDPFSATQIVSWLILGSSLFLALHGFYLLQKVGKPKGDFENTTRLVIVGAYRYIRHPLYSSLILLTWGIFFKDLTVLGFLLSSIASLFFYATAKVEESENVAKFGEAYAEYVKSTRMFLPFVL